MANKGVDIPIWPGSGSFFPGDTPFGLYDTDSVFQGDADNVAIFVAQKLGYPLVDIELQAINMYACFEEAVTEYGAQVNQFNIRDNMLDVKGYSTGSSFTGKDVTPSFGSTVRLSKKYGTETGEGGDIDFKSGTIMMSSSQQQYDLQALWGNVSESGNRIEVRRVFHDATPAISRFFDPYVGSGAGSQGMLEGFGWGNYSPGVSFLLMPTYADVLRIQAIEFNDQIRKSAFSFQLRNNKLKIFPIPTVSGKLHFEYIVTRDKDNPLRDNDWASSGSAVISDYSNIPYDNIPYRNINSVGRQWIRKYTLASAKELLGIVRGKYNSIPIPNADISLDGETLRSEATMEKERLITELRENLEATSRRSQLEKQREETENLQQSIARVPLKIYIG
jgi:hypothetical protein